MHFTTFSLVLCLAEQLTLFVGAKMVADREGSLSIWVKGSLATICNVEWKAWGQSSVEGKEENVIWRWRPQIWNLVWLFADFWKHTLDVFGTPKTAFELLTPVERFRIGTLSQSIICVESTHPNSFRLGYDMLMLRHTIWLETFHIQGSVSCLYNFLWSIFGKVLILV